MATKGLAALTGAALERWVAEARVQTFKGHLPDYIPLLATVNSEWVAVQVQNNDGQTWAAGEIDQPFVLMSVVKPLLLLFLLEQLGHEEVFAHVGMDPSDQSFHSVTQLRQDQGFPRNPMINSGAIALAARLPGKDGTARCEALRQWLNHISGSQLVLDQQVLASVRSLPNQVNRAIAHLLAESGHLDLTETALDTYNQICCLSGTVADLAKLGVVLAGRGAEERRSGGAEEQESLQARSQNEIIREAQRRRGAGEQGRADRLRNAEDEHPLPLANNQPHPVGTPRANTPHPILRERQRRTPLSPPYGNAKGEHPSPNTLHTVNALMLTCGLYEVSGRLAVQLGLPTKSGVSGALLAVVPGQGAIACYSPAIDQAGNSVAGLFLLERLTQTLNLSIFG